MFRRFRGKEKQREAEPDADDEVQENVIIAEERFLKMLSPMESHIMSFQSLLVWEKPARSAALVVGVNVLFWLATNMRIYSLIGLTGTVVTFADLWRNYIWPEIRVPVPPGEDEEDWVAVHPKFLSVPEICHYVAECWVGLTSRLLDVIQLRREHHAKFFIQATIIFLLLALFGYYVPGIYLSYITVMSCLLAPCVWHHDIVIKAYLHLEPCVRQMEDKFNIKRKRSKKGRRSGSGKMKRGEMPDPLDHLRDAGESESDSEDMRAFVPRLATTLFSSHGAKDSESDSEHPDLLSPPPGIPSRTPSRDDQLLNSDDETSFSLNPSDSQMPHVYEIDNSMADMQSLHNLQEEIDRQMQHSTNDFFDLAPSNFSLTDTPPIMKRSSASKSQSRSQSKELEFVSGHFKELSAEDADDEDLAMGLLLPDFDESAQAEDEERQEQQESTAQALFIAAAFQNSQAVTSTVSNIMTSTLSGLTQLRQTVMPATDPSDGTAAVMDSSAMVEAEFEFLSQDELDDSLHESIDDNW